MLIAWETFSLHTSTQIKLRLAHYKNSIFDFFPLDTFIVTSKREEVESSCTARLATPNRTVQLLESFLWLNPMTDYARYTWAQPEYKSTSSNIVMEIMHNFPCLTSNSLCYVPLFTWRWAEYSHEELLGSRNNELKTAVFFLFFFDLRRGCSNRGSEEALARGPVLRGLHCIRAFHFLQELRVRVRR